MKTFQSPRGTKDVIGSEALLFENIEKKAVAVFRDFAFLPIRTPVMEDVHLFQKSVGEASDIVQKEMFMVTREAWDEKESADSFCLRPEGTAPVVRAYIQGALQQERPVNKLYYYGPMFRAERPQKGRLRQFHQLGGEIIGSRSVLADVEIIEVMVRILEKLGVSGYRLEINNLGDAEDRAGYAGKLKGYLSGKESLCQTCKGRLEKNVLRVFDCKSGTCQSVLDGAPRISDHVSDASRQGFAAVQKHLKDLKINFEHNPRIVRGLDYYTHTVFELKHPALGEGSQNTLAAGGRYNGLVKQLGGQETPAVGFAMGMERLVLVMGQLPDQRAPWASVVWSGEGAQARAYKLLSELRANRISSYMIFDKKPIGDQLGLASKLMARYAVILGEAEVAGNKFKLRELESRDEKEFGIETFYDNVIQVIQKRMKTEKCHA